MSNDTQDRQAALAAARQELLRRRMQGSAAPAPDADAIRPRGDGPAPLSFAQQRLWLLHQIEPDATIYNEVMALRLEGALDVAALERALSEIVARHQVLRSVFAEHDGAGVQRVVDAAPLSLAPEDVSALDPAARDAAVAARIQHEKHAPYDLAAGPLFRASLLRLGAEEHALVIGLHHAVTDGWTRTVLQRELRTLYAAFARGQASPLAPLAVQYADYAAWQRRRLDGEALSRKLAWWTEHLAGAPALLELPSDRPRPAVQSFRGAREAAMVSPGLAEALRGLGREEGATLFMVLMAAFQTLLARYSGADDVVVGTPVAGRERQEVEALIGCFVNTLALRGDLSGDPTFRELLRRTRETAVNAFRHQDVPFETVVEAVHPERTMSHAPVFQVMFVLQNTPRGGAQPEGLVFRGMASERTQAKFDLLLEAIESPEGMLLSLEYATDLFDASTITRMLAHLRTLLDAAAAAPDTRIGALPLMDADDAARLAAWNATERAYALDGGIHSAFEAQAARTPDAVALVAEDGRMTYAELDARANRVARRLSALGVVPGSRVGVCLERGAGMVAALLGTLKAGAAYVPLDPGYPAERLAHMLEDAAVPVLVTETRLLDGLPAHTAAVLCLDRDEAAIEAESDAPLGIADAALPAYWIFTSGSTGRPKGAGNAHAGVLNRLWWMQEQYGLTADDAVLQKTPFSFDVSVWEFFWPLMTGARLVVARPEGHRDPAYLAQLIADQGVTTVHFVPSMLAAFLDGADVARCACLRRVMCSGEALPAELVERFDARMPAAARLHNLYGPTEAAVDVTFWAAPRGEARRTVPIGSPVANTRIHVLEPSGAPAPVGVPGELHIAGVQVGLGYLGRPGLTADRFVPDPFSSTPGARMYRTGDRARWTAEGVVEYLGRLDFQVKIRGLRIELGEIEAALAAHPEVREAVAAVRAAPSGDPLLVAYVVGDADAASLRAHLSRSLPEYMVPAAFVALERMPLSPNGKLDRRALPDPELVDEERAFVEPRTAAEGVLAGIWAELLGCGRVGVDDDFFALGGHSLLGVRVVSRVREVFGVELPLRALFDTPTLGGVAAAVEALQGAGGHAAPPVVPVPRDGELPLSFAQERLWFLDQVQPGGSVYNMPAAWRMTGALNVAVLEATLAEVVRRHESLRTTFRAGREGPRQVVHPAGRVSLEVRDLSALDPDAREAEALRVAVQEAEAPFDLAAGPLFRARLLRLDRDEHVLLMTMHHAVSDGWSIGLLAREIVTLYGAFARGEASPFADLPVQYADFAAWQRAWLAGEVLEAQTAYWRERLAGAPALLELPTDRPRPLLPSYRGGIRHAVIPRELLDRLNALSRTQGATLFMTLMAAFDVLLARWSGQDDVVVGTPMAGRTRRETEELIGFFLNTLALRTDLSGDPTFAELLARVRETTLGAYQHQELPFEKVVEAAQPERSGSHAPLFQVMFVLQNTPRAGANPSGLEIRGMGAEGTVAKFDLTLQATEKDDGLHLSLEYAADLFDPATAERMLAQLETLLAAAAHDPGARLSRLALVPADEHAAVLAAAAGPVAEVAAVPVHRLFEAQAARTPAADAVVMDGDTISYGELNARANRLARRLRALGVGVDARVATVFDRGIDAVVGMLAVLKAGGAYVPLDPATPADRRDGVLEDSAVRVALTTGNHADALPAGLAVVRVDAERFESEDAADLAIGIPAEALAYVIYTSGSTGKPKGVMVPHGCITNLSHSYVPTHGMTTGHRVLTLPPLTFDAFAGTFFPALMGGAALVFHPSPAELAGRALLPFCERHGVTVLDAPAALLKQLMDDLAALGPDAVPATLRMVMTGGEAIDMERIRRWGALTGGRVQIISHYGPTEATVSATVQLSQGPSAPVGDPQNLPMGTPVANTRVYVLDAHLRPQPAGVPGEVFIAGAGVTRGYQNRAAQTAAAFVPDPFAAEPGARMYRTGDRARRRVDGTLEFMGRLDFQVKIRGFRIEPGEIENVILALSGVRDAVVVVREDAPGDRRLVAYVVPGEGAVLDAAALRAGVQAALPAYMVPNAFVVLEAMPITGNGKVDRKALPAPDATAAADACVEPRDAVERVLAGIWADLLNVPRVGVEDDFFVLGGHSLLAVQAAARAQEAFGVEVPLRHVLDRPTVAGMAAALVSDPATGEHVASVAEILEMLASVSDDDAEAMLTSSSSVQ